VTRAATPLADRLARWWNWKCALLSCGLRGVIFFSTNLPEGLPAAGRALAHDLLFRCVVAGAFGAVIQRTTHWARRDRANLVTLVVLPVSSHLIEGLVHWHAATPRLGMSLFASIGTTAFSTAFDLYAMRHKTFLTGSQGQSFFHDLRGLPVLVVGFLTAPLRWLGRRGT
jgi:hypothetical protein